jgi:hypothetical protein
MANDDDKDVANRAIASKVSHILREDPLKLRDTQKRIVEGTLNEKHIEDEKGVKESIESFGLVLDGQLKDTVNVAKGQTVYLVPSTAKVSTTTVAKKEGQPAIHERKLVIQGSAANGNADKTKFVVKETEIGDLDNRGHGSVGTIIEKTVYNNNGTEAYRSTTNITPGPERNIVASTEITFEKDGITVKRNASKPIDDQYQPGTDPVKIKNEEMIKEYEARMKKLIEKGPQDESTNPVLPMPQQGSQQIRK